MYIVTGATGHVGASLIKTLVAREQKVLAVTHSLRHVPALKLAGAETAVVDLCDVESLSSVFARGESLFLLNPPADVSGDSVRQEKKTVECLLEALFASPIKRVVAESTQGAQPGDGIGDLGVLFGLEDSLRGWNGAVRITRAAYYFSNWDLQAETVRKTGLLQSFFPADFRLPMAAPEDLGSFNASLMMRNFEGYDIHEVSGPGDYSPSDVATEFARVFHRDVRVVVTPREKWFETYKAQGFSNASAKSYCEMTRLTLESDFATHRIRTSTSLTAYFDHHYGPKSFFKRMIAPLSL